jgi:hypothetical protein
MLKDVVVRVNVSTRQTQPSPLRCQMCQSVLDMHQPNQDRPEEMLGICAGCGEWHFVGASENDTSLVIACLPLRDLSTNPSRVPVEHGHEPSTGHPWAGRA